jgi:TonB family protein
MPSLKERDVNSALESAAARAGDIVGNSSTNRQQPVALEVPVTVNGARQLDGSDKREPFSESTKTVLVFDNGAVLRLGSAVAPGQLLFVTNEKTKKEAVCQVLNSKNYSNSNGYVEVQFTEPVSGFWGLRFPADRSAAGSAVRSASDPYGSAYSGGGMEGNAPMVVAAELEMSNPAVERFKAELKSEDRSSSRAGLLDSPELSIEPAKLQGNRLQEQLSARLFVGQQSSPEERPAQDSNSKALSDTTAKLFELAEANSIGVAPEKPAASAPMESVMRGNIAANSLPAEELKVPSWLQPLARNAANPAAAEEKPAEIARPSQPEPKSSIQEKPPKAPERKLKTVERPVFENTLLGQSTARANVSGARSNKGLLITIIAAGVLVTAAGATWYVRQSSEPAPTQSTLGNVAPATATGIPTAPASTAAAPESTAVSSEQVVPGAQNDSVALTNQGPHGNAASGTPLNASSTSAPAQPAVRTAVITEKVAKPNSGADAASAAATFVPEESVGPEPKKPGLGKVRPVKPKVSRNRQSNGIAEPNLTAAEQAVPIESSLGNGLLGGNSSQPAAPAAPAAVGGDVKPATLVSSVPPVYPPMAKGQHIAGDVRIDALIDAHGRVSAMKVVSGPTILQSAAMDALRQWKYQPATLNGNPVAMHLTVTIQFHLQ